MYINSINAQNTNLQQNTNFKATLINTSEMNDGQKYIAKTLHKKIAYSDFYDKLHKAGIDLVLLPSKEISGKRNNKIIIKFVERINDNFLRRKSNQYKQIETQLDNVRDNGEYSSIDRVIDFMKKIAEGNYQIKTSTEDDIINKKTDLAKIYPDVYKSQDCKDPLETKYRNDIDVSWRKYNLEFNDNVITF